ncbi:class I SAM-dependent methyltransferase [Neisseria lisongii]
MKPQLPAPSAEAQAASRKLLNILTDDIRRNGDMPFSRFMEQVLYLPELGYYSGGSHKIGAAGDFITAPTLSPLFGQTLARQLSELLPQTEGNLYEFGAGTGALAATLLNSLGDTVRHYYIIEISAELAERQRQFIRQQVSAEQADKVVHLTALPDSFNGIIIGNEVLDAMPVEVVKREHGTFQRITVAAGEHGLHTAETPLTDPDLLQAAHSYFPDCEPYTSELHPAQHAFIRTLAAKLVCGGMIWIDYGFDAAQYYHPQRNSGTLIGHYRHHTVHDPFFHVGLTDLTAHVNFTDIAQAGTDGGLDLIGYTTQANFLLNLGLTDLLAQHGDSRSPEYLKAAAAAQTLINPHEMGELFKVMAFGKNLAIDWTGFRCGDICHKL